MIKKTDQKKISKTYYKHWQEILDLLAETFEVDATMILKVNRGEFEVLLNSTKIDGFPQVGEKIPFNSGAYCYNVLQKKDTVYLKDIEEANLNSSKCYLGMPIFTPDRAIYGTICVMDHKKKEIPLIYHKILLKMKELIESDLDIFYKNEKIQQEKQELLAYTEKLDLILKNNNFSVIEYSIKENKIQVDQNISRIFGISQFELNGDLELFVSRINKNDQQLFKQSLKESINQKKPLRLEFRFKSITGNDKWCRLVANFSQVEKFQVKQTFMLGILIDIHHQKIMEIELKESESRFKEIIETSPYGNVINDGSIITYVNPASAKMIGLSQNVLINQNIFQFVDYNYHKLVKKRLLEIMENQVENEIAEIVLIRSDGEHFPVEISSVPITIHEKKQVLSVFRDITWRKQVEKELNQKENYLKYAQKMASVTSWVYNYFSKSFQTTLTGLEILGLEKDYQPQEKFPADVLFAKIHPEDRNHIIEMHKKAITSHHYDHLQFRIVVNKQIKYIHTLGEVRLDEFGNVAELAGVFQDISFLKITEKALSHSENIFKAIVEKLPIGAYLKDPKRDWRFTYWNPYMEKVTEINKEEVIGKNVFDLFNHEIALQYYNEDLEICATSKTKIIDPDIFFTRNKQQKYLRTIKQPVYDQDQKLVTLLCLSEDITLKKKIEEESINSQKMNAIGQLAGGIAHEFNNLLQAIISYSDLALEGINEESQNYRDIHQILTSSYRAKEIVNQLLTFSRKSNHKPEKFEINAFISRQSRILDTILPKDINFHCQLSNNNYFIYADQSEIEQVLLNLYLNSKEAMKDGGDLTVRISKTKIDQKANQKKPELAITEYVLIQVIDSGSGMDQETLSHIFEPFYTTKEVGDGMGLGLANVYSIIKSYGGIIHANSVVGHGTTMSIYLPLFRTIPYSISSKKIEVFYVESDDAIRNITKQLITEMGLIVNDVSSIHNLYRVLKDKVNNFDILMIDQNFPNLDFLILSSFLEEYHGSIIWLKPQLEKKTISPLNNKIQHKIELTHPYVNQKLIDTLVFIANNS